MPARFEARQEPEQITLRGGYVVDARVVVRLLDLEARGARFTLLPPPGRFQVDPPSILTPEDVAFLRRHRDEARCVIAYVERGADGPGAEPEHD